MRLQAAMTPVTLIPEILFKPLAFKRKGIYEDRTYHRKQPGGKERDNI
jgi:hypothetical protein